MDQTGQGMLLLSGIETWLAMHDHAREEKESLPPLSGPLKVANLGAGRDPIRKITHHSSQGENQRPRDMGYGGEGTHEFLFKNVDQGCAVDANA